MKKLIIYFYLFAMIVGCQNDVKQSAKNENRNINPNNKREIHFRILDSSEISISNDELLKLIDISSIDLEKDFNQKINDKRKLKTSIISKQGYESQSGKNIISIVGIQNPKETQTSLGICYFYLFKWENDKLIAHGKPILGRSGFSFGEHPKLERIVKIGKNSLGIILYGGYFTQGIFTEDRSIYIYNQKGISDVYSGKKLFDDSNYPSSPNNKSFNEYELFFQPNKTSNYMDIHEIKKNFGKKVDVKILKFNDKTMKYE
jgi:hypothetical protein